MREIRTQIDIEAGVDVVWEVLTDLEAYASWNPFIPRASGRVREGARLEVRIAPPGGAAMTFRPRVVQAVPGRSFRWLGRLLVPGLFDGEHAFELEPLAGGVVRLTQRERFGGVLVPLLWRRMQGPTRDGFRAMNEALKQRAEARNTPPG